MYRIPIFIITCDRYEVLTESILSYHSCIKTPIDIVIIDFGSGYKPTVELLKLMETWGIKVYWDKEIYHDSELNLAWTHIHDYFKTHPETNYIVTDPDIALDSAQGKHDALSIYNYFLETFPEVPVVGPMLRIDDIPDHYPLKDEILDGKMGLHKQFHSQKIHSIMYEDEEIRYIFAPIDTTFGMHKAGMAWKRLNMGIRVLPPYAAKHLDWYIDPEYLTPDQEYYKRHASKEIAHWSI